MRKFFLSLLLAILFCNTGKAHAVERVVIATVSSDVYYENIFLMANTIEGDWMGHKNFTVQVGFPPGELLYHFPNWYNDKFTPDLFYEDINADQLKDIIVVLVAGSGSGLSLKEVHVLSQIHDPNIRYEEVRVESINDAVKRLVKMERHGNEATILIGRKKYVVDISKFGYSIGFEERPFVGSWERNTPVNGFLEGSTLVYVSIGGTIGTLKIRYDWDGKMYKAKSVTFEEAEPYKPSS
ncbi:hypothetical protein [Peribacillus loiseleuriae]|uniref:hypothetical protein n=1 Tax=Peribacillus loiseleuriae TaxID=1679170 RepID=UPI003D03DC63